MGCDIHGFVQYTLPNDPSSPEPGDQGYLDAHAFGISRDYGLFTHLAGVRGTSISDIFMNSSIVPESLKHKFGDNYFKVPLRYWPLIPPRGYPTPLADGIKEHISDDCHSASYMNTLELYATLLRYADCYDLDTTAEAKAIWEACIDSDDWDHRHNWLDACKGQNWIRRIGRKGMAEDMEGIVDFMGKINAQKGYPTFVFCFDN